MIAALCSLPTPGQAADALAAAAVLPVVEQASAQAEEISSERSREGTRLVNQLGRFRTTGDRLTFQLEGSAAQVLGLENLALERIGKVLADRRDQADELQWEITGIYTEYRGTNYLLVTHAVLKSKGVRSAPVLSSAEP
jgi:hypothetical protein